MPMPMIVAGLLWAAGDIIGAVGFFTGNPLDNTGNLAHLSGMFLGAIYGFWFKSRFGNGKVSIVEDNYGRKVKLDEKSMQMWEDYYLR
jgi:membrane associated rhomboid family serine protease